MPQGALMERHWLESFSLAAWVAAKLTTPLTRRSLRAQGRMLVVESRSRRIKGKWGECIAAVSLVVLEARVFIVIVSACHVRRYQLRASTVPHEQPSDATASQQEVSWVKKECEGGSGGSSDVCGKRDTFGHAQRLCSCIAPTSR